MELEKALEIAERVKEKLKPYCERIEIAGSIRRKKLEVGDIEIVAISNDRFGLGLIVNRWEKVRGEVSGKYTQRILPEGIKLDLFFATKENWGLIYAIRSGNAEFSYKVLATGWCKKGYKSIKGMLHKGEEPIEVREEIDLFNLIGIDYIKPEERN
ncbi:hypothetical protein LCGC14_0374800 [marine sediment metagenome]|uniref:DNA polymerase beta thumb domain-containing protein n=1 Tax=marine sediment metagenome TaxID=412755 RepID=A0A0F9T499_9ZZZZ